MQDRELIRATQESAHPLHNADADYDPLLSSIGDARFVLIGEATHGTHEFYRDRALLTQRLIEEKGFSAVAVEADWPDAYRVNRFVRHAGADDTAIDSLGDFLRFPAWMWRNADVLDFVGRLRDHNDSLPPRRSKVGFYGLDLYSLHRSIESVLGYLEKHHPALLAGARQRYGCFETFGDDPQSYGLAAGFGSEPSCEEAVVAQLRELMQRRGELTSRDGQQAEDEYFFAEQNARLAKNAEEYYRQMYRGRKNTWNLRDTHMADTLDALAAHLDRTLGPGQSKIVVWAHNSHLGDARATEMGRSGELNLGQLCRQRHPHDTFNIGFSTHAGTVTAASNWGSPAERKAVRPSLKGTYERLFHDTNLCNFYLPLRATDSNTALLEGLRQPRLQRAIGVIYLPETERQSHYFAATLPDQFDAIIHHDHTRALEPLERTAKWTKGELPETYPTGV
jgi:erythromycin esterase-like protein